MIKNYMFRAGVGILLGILIVFAFTRSVRAEEPAAVVVEAAKAVDLKTEANNLLISMISGVKEAGVFLKDEIPVAIKELLTYYTALYVFNLVTTCVVVWFGVELLRRARGTWGEPCPTNLSAIGVSLVGIVKIIYQMCSGIPDLLKIILAPRIWLIEYAANLVR